MNCDNDTATLDFDCGISYARLSSWLTKELHLNKRDQRGLSPLVSFVSTWEFEDADGACRIELEPLEPRRLGLVDLERTRLLATGNAATLKRFEAMFTLRFMSAGG